MYKRQALNGSEDLDEARDARELTLIDNFLCAGKIVIGIAASGTTPYVIGAMQKAREHGILTGCITSNPDSCLIFVSSSFCSFWYFSDSILKLYSVMRPADQSSYILANSPSTSALRDRKSVV